MKRGLLGTDHHSIGDSSAHATDNQDLPLPVDLVSGHLVADEAAKAGHEGPGDSHDDPHNGGKVMMLSKSNGELYPRNEIGRAPRPVQILTHNVPDLDHNGGW